jgi:putative ABC transport system permease protein
MGIHTKSFGETAWLRDELLPHHFYEYLNAMAKYPGAVLLSRNFQTEHGYKIGDTISYSNADKETAWGYVCGFVDYWPGFQPITFSKGEDGVYKQTQEYLVIANLNQLQTDWGILPYEVWLKAEDSTQFIYDFAKVQDLQFVQFEDASAQIVSMKKDPVIQGTNGILTVGFAVVLILCCVGFLIYWIVSIRVRQLQFGIYRAMGMSVREILGMLLCEQLLISGSSILIGVLSGSLVIKLFLPLIQAAYSGTDQILPVRIVSQASDSIRLFVIVGLMIVVCMAVLIWLISKIHIAQALKLGED